MWKELIYIVRYVEKELPEDIKAPAKYQLFHLHKSVVGRCCLITPLHE